ANLANAFGLACHGHDQIFGLKQAFCHALDVRSRNSFDLTIAPVDIVDTEMVELDGQELRSDFPACVEPKCKRADEVVLGSAKLLRGEPIPCGALELRLDEIERLPDGLIFCGNAPRKDSGMIQRIKIGIDGISKPALLTHFLHEL